MRYIYIDFTSNENKFRDKNYTNGTIIITFVGYRKILFFNSETQYANTMDGTTRNSKYRKLWLIKYQ